MTSLRSRKLPDFNKSSINSAVLTFPNWAIKIGSGFCDNLEPISREEQATYRRQLAVKSQTAWKRSENKPDLLDLSATEPLRAAAAL